MTFDPTLETQRAMALYPTLHMQRLGSIVFIQAFNDDTKDELAGPALTCDLETGTLALAQLPQVEVSSVPVYGVLGMAKLDAGPALVVITGIEQAATLRGQPLYKITATQVLTDSQNGRWTAEDRKLLSLLKSGVDPRQYGGSLYFSRGGDATLMQQRYEAAAAGSDFAATPAWKRAEPAFFWNHNLATPLLSANMERFVPVAFMGFAGSLGHIQLSTPTGTHTAGVTLIARRSCRRPGCRQWRRGSDMSADVANYVESEQIVELDGGAVVSSYVQVRGSIPILWSQAPNLEYKIPIHLAPTETSAPVLSTHIAYMEKFYGKVTAINLANQTGREGKLSAAYKAAADAVAKEHPNFRLLPFDFHKHCGATNYGNLELLWHEVSRDAAANAYWLAGSIGEAQQGGVFRTNCVDTLDRTNVVQGMLARKQLEHLLRSVGWLHDGVSLATAYPKVPVVNFWVVLILLLLILRL